MSKKDLILNICVCRYVVSLSLSLCVFKIKKKIIVSAADSRVVAFAEVPDDQRFWIKHKDFTLRKLIDYKDDPGYFDNG